MPGDEEIMTTADRGSLAPQRGEGLRVRGETASVVGIYTYVFVRFKETGGDGQFYAPAPHSLGEGGKGFHILTRSEEFCPAPLRRVAGVLLFLVLLSFANVCAIAGDANSDPLHQKAQLYLQSILPPGQSLEDLAKKFGPPRFKYEAPNKELCAIFMFPGPNPPAVLRAAHVDGFSAFLVKNRMTHWAPVYEEQRPAATDAASKPAAARFVFDRPRLAFYLVSPKPAAGFVFVDGGEFKKLGYLNKNPALAVRIGQFILSDSAPRSTHTIEFILAPADADKLRILTTGNVGKRLAVAFNGQVISAPFVFTPLPDGHVLADLSDPTYWSLSKFLRTSTVPAAK